MRYKHEWSLAGSLLLICSLSFSGCATQTAEPLPPGAAPQVQLPPLPSELRPRPLPEWCRVSSTELDCSMKAQQVLQSWRNTLWPATTVTPK